MSSEEGGVERLWISGKRQQSFPKNWLAGGGAQFFITRRQLKEALGLGLFYDVSVFHGKIFSLETSFMGTPNLMAIQMVCLSGAGSPGAVTSYFSAS